MIWCLCACRLSAETIEVFECVSEGVVHKGKKEGMDVSVEQVKPGAALGIMDTGSADLKAIVDQALATSWVGEPFYGPVVKFILKDSSKRLFIAHFEYLKGHKVLGEGLRFAIIELTPVQGKAGVFEGDPYNGSSVTEKSLLPQFKTLADKLAAPAKKP